MLQHKFIFITVNYYLCCRIKLHLFILLNQMRRNYELGRYLYCSSSSKNSTLRNNDGQNRDTSSLSLFEQSKWCYRNNRGIFSWYGKVIWFGKGSAQGEQVESIEEKQADQFDSASEEEDDFFPTSTSNIASLNVGSLFLGGCLCRIGWWIKILNE